MSARKMWRVTEPVEPLSQCNWRREDGTIDLHKFDPEALQSPEECAELTDELDKAISYFAGQLRGYAAERTKTGFFTDRKLYDATHNLWTLAKRKRNLVQDRRGKLRRERNGQIRESSDVRDERRFIHAAKQMLSESQYLAIWEQAISMKAAEQTEKPHKGGQR